MAALLCLQASSILGFHLLLQVCNLSTGPVSTLSSLFFVYLDVHKLRSSLPLQMLDRVTPLNQKTFIQGLNSAVYDTAYAIFPIVFGWVSDTYGGDLVLWLCAGFGVLAALVNLPLVFHPSLAKLKSEEDDKTEPPIDIDEVEIQKLLDNGEYVSVQSIYQVNQKRADMNEPFLRTRFGKYSRGDISMYKQISGDDIKFVQEVIESRLGILHEKPELKKAYLQTVNANSLDAGAIVTMKEELEKWMVDYLDDNGYLVGFLDAQIFKAIFMESFQPIIHGSELTVDNMEDALIGWDKVLNQHAEKIMSVEKTGALKRLKYKAS